MAEAEKSMKKSLKEMESTVPGRIIQILSESGPTERADLIRKLDIYEHKTKLQYHLDKMLKSEIIKRSKGNPIIYSLSEDNQLQEFVIEELIEDGCSPKTTKHLKKSLAKKHKLSESVVDQAIRSLLNKYWIEERDEKNEFLYAHKQIHRTVIPPNNTFEIRHYHLNSKYNVCRKCLKKIKPKELKIFRADASEGVMVHEFYPKKEDFSDPEDYEMVSSPGSSPGVYTYPRISAVVHCFHAECLSKSKIAVHELESRCSHCFLPLNRMDLIKEVNLNFNDTTLISKIDELFDDKENPSSIIWSSIKKEFHSQHIELNDDTLEKIIEEQHAGLCMSGDSTLYHPNIDEYEKTNSTLFMCKEIEGKKYHPYCAKQIKKK